MGRPDDTMDWIVVLSIRKFVQIKASKTPSAILQLRITWVGKAEVVEVDVALALVKLVITSFKFPIDPTKTFKLLGYSIPVSIRSSQKVITAPKV